MKKTNWPLMIILFILLMAFVFGVTWLEAKIFWSAK